MVVLLTDFIGLGFITLCDLRAVLVPNAEFLLFAISFFYSGRFLADFGALSFAELALGIASNLSSFTYEGL